MRSDRWSPQKRGIRGEPNQPIAPTSTVGSPSQLRSILSISINLRASAGAGALLVIVEIDEDGSPLPAPSNNVARPGSQRPIRIMTFVASAGPVSAYVDVTRSYLPR